ncbi:immune inhibitor A domain-containing protein [Nocardioides sp. GXQ0305]|uniref:immune inhibitor A domain-containing protein n=1 Tax=Nocardioides sp. GXQ0305 TaxID=3423912 RepID=UPI003D7C7B3D
MINTPAWAKKYEAERLEALEQRLRTGGTGAAERISKNTYGRVATTGQEKIFVVLAEFGDVEHPAVPDGDSNATTFDGPVHNDIPKPDRSKDNSTLWQADYDVDHYENMYFDRMRKFYERESHGKFTFGGDVTEWVKVPFNQARYGRNEANTPFLVRDALAYWVEAKMAPASEGGDGWTMQQVTDYLETFDEVDRYDFDEDGDFKEPDGFIDHFQIVHAGGDESDGDPVYGEDAIWAHKGHAQVQPPGTGPEGGADIGGVNVGEGGPSGGGIVNVPDNPTGVWVNDYTVQPENGGLSVFAHEFAHDLGLPDLYDTSGNDGGAENSVGFWSLMAQSRGTLPSDDGIGDRPMPFGAWDKFSLGWLDYKVTRAGRSATHKIRPNQSSDSSAVNDGAVVLLPDKEVTTEVGAPCGECGSRYFYSDQGNDLENTMTREVEGGGPLTAVVNYEIEQDWDYAFLESSSDDGESWDKLETNLSDKLEDHEDPAEHDQSGFNDTDTGMTGTTNGWTEMTATVPDDATHVRFVYKTDGAAVESGFRVDNVAIDGTPIGTAEANEGWVLDGFRTTTGTDVSMHTNAYFVDNRQYVGGDRTLKHLYNFAGYEKRPNWVDYFQYSPGALITYWDSSYFDNNVGEHPGHGELLPVDANPEFDHAPDGSLLRPRISAHDAAFGLTRTQPVTLHFLGEKYTLSRHAGQRLFDDTEDWWYAGDEHASSTEQHPGHYQPGWFSVDVPKSGTTIRVAKVNKKGVMTVEVGTSR